MGQKNILAGIARPLISSDLLRLADISPASRRQGDPQFTVTAADKAADDRAKVKRQRRAAKRLSDRQE